jgi:hypothetical protein
MRWHRCHSFKEAFDLKTMSGLQSHLMQVRAPLEIPNAKLQISRKHQTSRFKTISEVAIQVWGAHAPRVLSLAPRQRPSLVE